MEQWSVGVLNPQHSSIPPLHHFRFSTDPVTPEEEIDAVIEQIPQE
jgi:hypothetical protein